MNKVQFKRFDNLIKMMREVAADDDLAAAFDMRQYYTFCGSPSCILGSYSARPDLQRAIKPGKRRTHDWVILPVSKKTGRRLHFNDPIILEHFGITNDEAERLFSRAGCAFATTPTEVVKFLKAFVQVKRSGR